MLLLDAVATVATNAVAAVLGQAVSSGGQELCSAAAELRQVCTLAYLNGAAPVVYGWPVRFEAQ
jgi:hypothetical protein